MVRVLLVTLCHGQLVLESVACVVVEAACAVVEASCATAEAVATIACAIVSLVVVEIHDTVIIWDGPGGSGGLIFLR